MPLFPLPHLQAHTRVHTQHTPISLPSETMEPLLGLLLKLSADGEIHNPSAQTQHSGINQLKHCIHSCPQPTDMQLNQGLRNGSLKGQD